LSPEVPPAQDASYITGHTLPVDGGYLAAGVLEI
jgi:hypothetical protein